MPPTLTTPQQQGLLRQPEFYFSDESFTYDAFLQSEADDAGAVPASTLAAFPKVASLLPEHTDEERRAAVLAVVALSDSIVLSGDDRIKRLFPLQSRANFDVVYVACQRLQPSVGGFSRVMCAFTII